MAAHEENAVRVSTLPDEEIAEIRELFPELPDKELFSFISALDCTIDKVLDSYFGFNEEQKLLYANKS